MRLHKQPFCSTFHTTCLICEITQRVFLCQITQRTPSPLHYAQQSFFTRLHKGEGLSLSDCTQDSFSITLHIGNCHSTSQPASQPRNPSLRDFTKEIQQYPFSLKGNCHSTSQPASQGENISLKKNKQMIAVFLLKT